ncbi:MAG: hypothetical protein V4494_07405 [Chlamydiota bacterium]
MVREISSSTGVVSSLSQNNNIMSERLELAREAQSLCDRAIRGIDTLASALSDLSRQADETVALVDRVAENSTRRLAEAEESRKIMQERHDRIMNSEGIGVKKIEREPIVITHHKKKEKQRVIERPPTICERILSWIRSFFG